jgi:hypothetical protein
MQLEELLDHPLDAFSGRLRALPYGRRSLCLLLGRRIGSKCNPMLGLGGRRTRGGKCQRPRRRRIGIP